MEMDTQAHWERVYGTKAPTEVSWFRPHLETSLSLIERIAGDRSASIIDVGGGESTLVDDLIGRGYRNVTVLDISRTAIEHTKKRLGFGIAAGHLARLPTSPKLTCRRILTTSGMTALYFTF